MPVDAFEEMQSMGHEQVVFCRNPEVGLQAIIAVHNTVLGPALGGARLYPYKSANAALVDALRLSRGMTYKAALAGCDLGGGKAVIIGDPSMKSEGLFRAFGRFVESLGGRYITAEDMNTTVDDMSHIQRETSYVTGSSQIMGGSGNPAPLTAWGVYHGIRACLEIVYGSPDVEGRTIAIQGVGNVGYHLSRYLHDNGAKLIYTDIHRGNITRALEEFGGTAVDGDEIYSQEVDVLAPCAIGAVMNPKTIPLLRTPIVAGAANNILHDEERDGEALMERDILYAPDYAINAGGLMSVWSELNAWPSEKSFENAANIYHTVKKVFSEAKSEGVTFTAAANRVAEQRIADVRRIHEFRVNFSRGAAPRPGPGMV